MLRAWQALLVTANAITGTYPVTATVNNGVNDVAFGLTNLRLQRCAELRPAWRIRRSARRYTLDLLIASH